ncbi:hypothetical protein ACFE04_016265 [Oxalis oulophora]
MDFEKLFIEHSTKQSTTTPGSDQDAHTDSTNSAMEVVANNTSAVDIHAATESIITLPKEAINDMLKNIASPDSDSDDEKYQHYQHFMKYGRKEDYPGEDWQPKRTAAGTFIAKHERKLALKAKLKKKSITQIKRMLRDNAISTKSSRSSKPSKPSSNSGKRRRANSDEEAEKNHCNTCSSCTALGEAQAAKAIIEAENAQLRNEMQNLHKVLTSLQEQITTLQEQLKVSQTTEAPATLNCLPVSPTDASQPPPTQATPSVSQNLDKVVSRHLERLLGPLVEKTIQSVLGPSGSAAPPKKPPATKKQATPHQASTNQQPKQHALPQQVSKQSAATVAPPPSAAAAPPSSKRARRDGPATNRYSTQEGEENVTNTTPATTPPVEVTATPAEKPAGPSYAAAAGSDWTEVTRKRGKKKPPQLPPRAPATQSTTTKPSKPTQRAAQKKELKPLKHDPSSLLVLPTEKDQRAYEILRNSTALDPHALGIKHHVEFPNGAVLLRCATQDQVKTLRTLIPAVPGTTLKEERTRKPEFYVHNVPNTANEAQIKASIARVLGSEPEELKILPYNKPVQPNTVYVVCSVDAALYEVAKKRRTIRIGWSACPIRTTPYIPRCALCHLLGHKEAKCPSKDLIQEDSMEGNSQANLPDLSQSSPCHDCKAFNQKILEAKLGRKRCRPTDHPTNSAGCPTRIAWIRRMLPNTTPATAAKPPSPSEDLSSRASILSTAAEKNLDIIAITEPYAVNKEISAPGWVSFVNDRAAILVRPHLARGIMRLTPTPDNTVCCRLGDIYLVCSYLPPKPDIIEDLSALSLFLTPLRGPLCLLGDFNCRTALIPGQPTNARGESFEEFLDSLNLSLANNSSATWERKGNRRVLDYMCFKNLQQPTFEVLDEDSCSDHHFVQSTIQCPGATIPTARDESHLNKELLQEEIKNIRLDLPAVFATTADIDTFVMQLTALLQEAVHRATRHRTSSPTPS